MCYKMIYFTDIVIYFMYKSSQIVLWNKWFYGLGSVSLNDSWWSLASPLRDK